MRATKISSGNKPVKKLKSKTKTKKTTTSVENDIPWGILLYGPSGVGKTSIAAHLDDVGFIIDPKEIGIHELVQFGQCPEPTFVETAESFSHTLELLENIALGKLKCKNLCMDALTGFELMCFQEHCEQYYEGDWSSSGFLAFQQGPKNAAKVDWPRYLDALTNVRNAGVNVTLIGHSKVAIYNNPEGPDYDRYSCYLDKEIYQATHRWASAILFLNFVDEITKESKASRSKGKTDSDQRNIYTIRTAAFDAKNRWGLPPLIDAGESGAEAAENFMEAYNTAKAK